MFVKDKMLGLFSLQATAVDRCGSLDYMKQITFLWQKTHMQKKERSHLPEHN